MRIKITQSENDDLNDLSQFAFDTNFIYTPVLLMRADGSIAGKLPEEFLLDRPRVRQGNSAFILGLECDEEEGITGQSIELNVDTLRLFIEKQFGSFDMSNNIKYRKQTLDNGGGFFFCVEIAWNFAYQTDQNGDFGESGWDTYLFKKGDVPHFATKEYISRREAKFPGSIDDKFPRDTYFNHIVAGRSSGMDMAFSSFNRNTVLYIRSVEKEYEYKSGPRGWKDFSVSYSTSKLSDLRPGTDFVFKPLLTGRSSKTSDPNIFLMGGNVFSSIDVANKIVTHPDEIFRNECSIPFGYNQEEFFKVLQELILNAFCHGAWMNGYDSSDNDTMNAITLTHFGNRLEVANRGGGGRSFTLSPVHLALKDIGLVHGRQLGLRIARKRVINIGMSQPIIIGTEEAFRVVFPLHDDFSEWYCSQSRQNEVLLGRIFALQLIIVLKALNARILSAALRLPLIESARILSELAEESIIDRAGPVYISDVIGSDEDLMVFQMQDSPAILNEILRLRSKFTVTSSPPGMSRPGLLALSRFSIKQRYVRSDQILEKLRDIFLREGVYSVEDVDMHATSALLRMQG